MTLLMQLFKMCNHWKQRIVRTHQISHGSGRKA
jgi:hypothetical protein